MEKILIIEDDEVLADTFKTGLEGHNFEVMYALSGKQGLEIAKSFNPFVVILDLGLPDINGIELIKPLKEYTPYVIIVSCFNDTETVKKAYLEGACDYMTKPRPLEEWVVKINSFRRDFALKHHKPAFKSGNLEIDFEARIVKVKGEIVKLSRLHFKILKLFVNNPGKILGNEFLLREVWGRDYVCCNDVLRTQIKEIRKIIEDDHTNPKFILTIQGEGYSFNIPE